MSNKKENVTEKEQIEAKRREGKKIDLCVWIFGGSPIEIHCVSMKQAEEKYDEYEKQLDKRNDIIKHGSFVGIRVDGKVIKEYQEAE